MTDAWLERAEAFLREHGYQEDEPTPPGPCERADSPMRRVNVEAWTGGQLNPAPLCREAVEGVAQSTRVLLPGEKR